MVAAPPLKARNERKSVGQVRSLCGWTALRPRRSSVSAWSQRSLWVSSRASHALSSNASFPDISRPKQPELAGLAASALSSATPNHRGIA